MASGSRGDRSWDGILALEEDARRRSRLSAIIIAFAGVYVLAVIGLAASALSYLAGVPENMRYIVYIALCAMAIPLVVLPVVWASMRFGPSGVRARRRTAPPFPALVAPIQPGDHLVVKKALYDVSVAHGRRMPPAVYIVLGNGVNACVFGTGSLSVAVTEGMAQRLNRQQLSAVFAHLFTRHRLLGDGWNVRVGDPALCSGGPSAEHLVLSMACDARALLTLKHPEVMLDTLEKVLPVDNHVHGANDSNAHLFFAWPTSSEAGVLDPEMVRIDRLKSLSGAEGSAWQVSREAILALVEQDAFQHPPLEPAHPIQ